MNKTALRSIYKAGCLFEYGNLSTDSMINYSFDESLSTCRNKSIQNVSARACKILRKLLHEVPNPILSKMVGWTAYIEYYKNDRKNMIEAVVSHLASSFIVKYHEWERANESLDTGR